MLHSSEIYNNILFFEKDNSLSSDAYIRLSKFSDWLDVNIIKFEEEDDQFSLYIFILMKEKFFTYYTGGKQPSLNFFRAVCFLDPFQLRFLTFNSTLVKSVFPKLSKNVEVDAEIETYVTLANQFATSIN